jgi:hypothetical protein
MDDTAPTQPSGAARGGIKALADRFMSSGTAFSPNAAIAATASSAIANATVREAVTAVQIESSYMTNMVQNLRGGYGTMAMRGSGYGTMATRGGSMFGSRASTMAARQYGGARTMGMFGGPSALTTGSEAFSNGIQAMKSGLKANIGIGAAIGAVMSLVQNISGVAKGTISKGEAAGNVATDTVSSGISAAGGAILGGVATAALGAVGIAGLPLTLLGLGAGLLGGIATDSWFRKTKIATGIHDMVAQAFAK